MGLVGLSVLTYYVVSEVGHGNRSLQLSSVQFGTDLLTRDVLFRFHTQAFFLCWHQETRTRDRSRGPEQGLSCPRSRLHVPVTVGLHVLVTS